MGNRLGMSDLDVVVSFFVSHPGEWFSLRQVIIILGIESDCLVNVYKGMKRKFRTNASKSVFVSRPGMSAGRLVWEYCYKKRGG